MVKRNNQNVAVIPNQQLIERRKKDYNGSDPSSELVLMPPQLRVYVPPHPLIKHWLGVARDAATPPPLFKSAMTECPRSPFPKKSVE